MATNPEKEEHGIQNARGWAESIIEDMAALELATNGQNPCEACDGEGVIDNPADPSKPDCEACDGSGSIDPDDSAREEIMERIQEGPLSVEVRSGWYCPGNRHEGGAPEEYCILLSTGGPALRIVGDLDEHGQPDSARLQWQDWGTPWTEVFDLIERDTLTAYASQFYFGEGS